MGVAKSLSGVLQAWDYSSGESVGVLAVQNVLLLQILSGQSQLKKSTVTTDLGLKRLYTGLRTIASQVHTGSYLT